ncbi:uncharacterized protein BDV17DRAFT_257919 [Aspergillus undulatus]|uniref:uncharacterized protein n=1 Tax=Aspergillus undulatus TaxID=1810928 RepID=UPI003CCD288A
MARRIEPTACMWLGLRVLKGPTQFIVMNDGAWLLWFLSLRYLMCSLSYWATATKTSLRS